MLRRYLLFATPVIILALAFGPTAPAEPAGEPESTIPMHEHDSDAIVDWVANARTASDHEAIARHFDAEAARFVEQIALHEKLAQTYRMGGAARGVKGSSMAKHCERLVVDYADAARTQRELAAMHRELALAAGR